MHEPDSDVSCHAGIDDRGRHHKEGDGSLEKVDRAGRASVLRGFVRADPGPTRPRGLRSRTIHGPALGPVASFARFPSPGTGAMASFARFTWSPGSMAPFAHFLRSPGLVASFVRRPRPRTGLDGFVRAPFAPQGRVGGFVRALFTPQGRAGWLRSRAFRPVPPGRVCHSGRVGFVWRVRTPGDRTRWSRAARDRTYHP
jgi:hypothetical protein